MNNTNTHKRYITRGWWKCRTWSK